MGALHWQTKPITIECERMVKRTSCPATVISTLGDPSTVRERWERGREGRSRCTWSRW